MGRIKSPHSHIVYGSKNGPYLVYGTPSKLVHIIIAYTFLPNPENKPEVNHKDKDCTNNKVENLEWATRREQMIHAHKNSNPDRYSTSRAVKQYDLEGNFIGEYGSISQAVRQTGCSNTCISGVCHGGLKSTKGFVFKYINENLINQPMGLHPKKVDLIDEKGNVLETYESTRTAALDLEIHCTSIYQNLHGDTKKTKGGYRFKYH